MALPPQITFLNPRHPRSRRGFFPRKSMPPPLLQAIAALSIGVVRAARRGSFFPCSNPATSPFFYDDGDGVILVRSPLSSHDWVCSIFWAAIVTLLSHLCFLPTNAFNRFLGAQAHRFFSQGLYLRLTRRSSGDDETLPLFSLLSFPPFDDPLPQGRR